MLLLQASLIMVSLPSNRTITQTVYDEGKTREGRDLLLLMQAAGSWMHPLFAKLFVEMSHLRWITLCHLQSPRSNKQKLTAIETEAPEEEFKP